MDIPRDKFEVSEGPVNGLLYAVEDTTCNKVIGYASLQVCCEFALKMNVLYSDFKTKGGFVNE